MYSTIDVDESGYESDKTDATAFSDSYLVPFEQEDDNEEEDEPDTAGEHSFSALRRASTNFDCTFLV